MPKTYYLGKTKAGALVARASGSDYGYTHAAVTTPLRKPVVEHGGNKVIHMSDANFSRSSAGALKSANGAWRVQKGEAVVELVDLAVVDRASYLAATGRA